MPRPVVRPASVRRPSLAFPIFDISPRTINWIELKLSGRHCGDMEVQNCLNCSVLISSQIVGRIEPNLDGRHHSDTEIQNC